MVLIKILLVNVLFLVAFTAVGQLKPVKSGTTPEVPLPLPVVKNDSILTLPKDSVSVSPETGQKDSIPKPILESIITYSAEDSIIPDFENQKMYLYKGGVINYENIELRADYIMLDLVNKEVYAEGLPDSTGVVVGTPVFKDGGDEFESKTLRYNFETQKGIIADVKTKQGDGFVHSDITKKVGEDEFILERGKYTTCDADHPHFYLRMTKAKVISNKKIITGPAYMVLEDFPIYFPMIPFGYFPNSTTYTSGILIPTYGEEHNRGFFLREGGYYWAASDHFDLAVKGDIFSKGSWATNIHTNYKTIYRFSGSFDFRYNLNKYSEKPLPDARTDKGFSLAWSHSQDSKANPSRTFNANVNLSSASYDKENSYLNSSVSVQSYLQTQKSSSISYSKKFENSPFNMSASFRHSQNSRDSTLSVSFPELTFNMAKINPFKRKVRIGGVKWYEKISISYSGNIRNSISNVKEDQFFRKNLIKDWQNGWKHSIPITLPSFNLFKYINLSPTFSYNERWYTSTINKIYNPGAQFLPPLQNHVEIDTVYGFRRNYDYAYSISSSTNIYGMYTMRNPNSRIKAIRHKMTPSVSLSYMPDFSQKKFGFWGTYTDETGKEVYYNHFDRTIFGSAGRGESGSISFSLMNNLEAKVLDVASDSLKTKDDKVKYKKVKIIDNLGFSGSYNMIADSMKMSTIAVTARTTIKGISVNMGATLDPYMVDQKGNRYNEYVWNHLAGVKKLGRLTSANMSFGMNFQSKQGKKNNAPGGGEKQEGEQPAEQQPEPVKEDGPLYADFNIPWTFRFDYTLFYSNSFKPDSQTGKINKTLNQGLSMSGTLKLTQNWDMSMNTNFDIQAMKFSFTTFNVSRILHCWNMSFGFVPFGDRKSYSFTLSASSSILQDLKVSKQSSWRDN